MTTKKILNDPEIKIVVELIGGETVAKQIIIEAFEAKKECRYSKQGPNCKIRGGTIPACKNKMECHSCLKQLLVEEFLL